jgi:hypothetical protein
MVNAFLKAVHGKGGAARFPVAGFAQKNRAALKARPDIGMDQVKA